VDGILDKDGKPDGFLDKDKDGKPDGFLDKDGILDKDGKPDGILDGTMLGVVLGVVDANLLGAAESSPLLVATNPRKANKVSFMV